MVDIFGIPFNLVIPDGGAGGEQGTGAREAQQVGGWVGGQEQQVLVHTEPHSLASGSLARLAWDRQAPPRLLELPRGRRLAGARKVMGGSCDPHPPMLGCPAGLADGLKRSHSRTASAKAAFWYQYVVVG